MIEEELISGKRDIVVQKRDRSLQRVSQLHSSYCALRYPLLFTHGEQGWHLNMSHIRKYFVHEITLVDEQ